MVAEPSQLERLLKDQLAGADLDSSGRFTLAREKALEKLSQFQLAEPTWWVLKIVQAAVASKATELVVRQTSTDTEFFFTPGEPWSVDQVEDALFDPEVSSSPGLDHFKRGLWSATLNQGRPFQLQIAGERESLLWTAKGPSRVAGSWDTTCLTVSHRTLAQGKGLPILRNIEAARLNAELLLVLRERASTCPIPLLVDRRRLDALQAHPTFGHSRRSFPFFVAATQDPPPLLPLPPGTWRGFVPVETAEPQPAMLTTALSGQTAAGSAMLLSFHAQQVTRNKKTFWEALQAPSMFHWVLDGVVVATEPLLADEHCVSAAVFVSAEGLTLDISGFGIRSSDESRARVAEACRCLDPSLQAATLSLAELVKKHEGSGRAAGIAFAVGGVMLMMLSPLHGLGLAGYGAYQMFTAGKEQRTFEAALQAGLYVLQRDWPLLYRKPKSGPRWLDA
jgi:hypothetical protein